MTGTPALRRWLLALAGVAFALALATFLVTANVRWAAGSVALWGTLFDRNQSVRRTGIERPELMRGARQVLDYFRSDREPLTVLVRVGGIDRAIFSDREVAHMADVKRLFQWVFRVQDVTAGVLVGILLGGLITYRRRFLRPLAWMTLAGGGITVAFVAIVGLVSLVDFDAIFTVFHVLSFANDLWQMDPASSYLVRMFPLGFWLDVTLLIGLASVAEAALLMGGAIAYLRMVPAARHGRQAASPESAPRDAGAS